MINNNGKELRRKREEDKRKRRGGGKEAHEYFVFVEFFHGMKKTHSLALFLTNAGERGARRRWDEEEEEARRRRSGSKEDKRKRRGGGEEAWKTIVFWVGLGGSPRLGRLRGAVPRYNFF